MVQIWKWLDGFRPTLLMVAVQVVSAAANVFYKLAVCDGMNFRIIVAYRFIFATAFMVPLALMFERKRPKLTWMLLFQLFLCGLFGGSALQNMYVESLALTSLTFVTAMTNLLPAVTFILSIFFGLEKMGIVTREGQAKVVGTLIGIGGAMVLTFWKGAEIDIWPTPVNLLKHYQGHGSHLASHAHHSRALGSLLAVLSCFSSGFWLIIQAKMSARYPCPYSSTALMSTMASIQAVGFAICFEKDWTQWKLGWNIRLVSVAFLGIVVAGLMITVISWCVRMRGPLFVSNFSPLTLVLVAFAGSLLLDEKLHLGSVIGAIFIVVGLYMVLWGKAKEIKRVPRPAALGSFRAGEITDNNVVISLPQAPSSPANPSVTA